MQKKLPTVASAIKLLYIESFKGVVETYCVIGWTAWAANSSRCSRCCNFVNLQATIIFFEKTLQQSSAYSDFLLFWMMVLSLYVLLWKYWCVPFIFKKKYFVCVRKKKEVWIKFHVIDQWLFFLEETRNLAIKVSLWYCKPHFQFF